MSRGLSAPQIAASNAQHVQIAPLIQIAFASGNLYATTAPWDITVGPITYIGIGPMLSIKQQTEAVGSFEGIEIVMSGLDASIIALASMEPYRGRIVKVLKAWLDADTNQVIGAPVVKFIGRIRSMPMSETNSEATVTIQVEHFEAELQRAAPLRYNNSDQQRLYPSDYGLEFIEQNLDRVITWPNREALKK